jgi:hypothetical protein
MCCFSRPIPFVGATKIFARHTPDGRQVLAYAMDVELDAELAMVLPLPVPPRSGDDAVTFVSLEGYEGFFGDLAAAFPQMMTAQSKSRGRLSLAAEAPKLVVHDVGAFEASFVPTLADFARLDERLTLPPGTWESLPGYADWGFAVFRLKPKKALLGWKRQSIHPMAMSFPTREPGALYFPLLHIHHGEVEPNASFDHELYGQADGVLGATLGWQRSKAPLGAHVDATRARGLVDGERGGFQLGLRERLPNMDLWLREPAGVSVADLSGAGDCHAYEVRAERAYAFGERDARFLRWRETASTHLATLCRAMRERLPEVVARNRAGWHLAPITGDMPAHFINGDQLWTGTDYTNGKPAPGGGRGRVTFSPFSDDVPVQTVVLGFDELPERDRVREIHAELSRTLQRAVAR